MASEDGDLHARAGNTLSIDAGEYYYMSRTCTSDQSAPISLQQLLLALNNHSALVKYRYRARIVKLHL